MMEKENDIGDLPVSGVLTIDEIEVIPLDLLPALRRVLPTGPIQYGETGMVGRSVLVAVRAGGITGWGQIRPVNPFQSDTASSAVAALRDYYGPLAVGRNAWHRGAMLRDMERKLPPNSAALAMFDVALHDLLGRALDVPVHALLGGACKEEIPLEWSVGAGPVKQMVDEAEEIYGRFKTPYICFKAGPAAKHDENLTTLRAVRKALGDGPGLALDANGSLRPREAIRMARALADVGLAYFEQPVPRQDHAGMKRVRDHGGVPVMADETVYSPQDAMATLQGDIADVLCVKLYKSGGLWRGRQIALIAEGAGVDVNCAGTANGSHLEALAAAHFCAAVPNHAFGAEFTMGLPEVAEDPIVPQSVMPIGAGVYPVPNRPGLGADVDERAVERHAIGRFKVA